MGELVPLLGHDDPLAPVAWRGGGAVSARQFLADAAHLATLLPLGAPVLNACTDRYAFATGLAAALLAGNRSLLPPTHTPELIRQLQRIEPAAICLTDDPRCAIALPRLPYPAQAASRPGPWPPPAVPGAQVFADVYTSGSTGVPLAQRKSWGKVARCVAIEAQRLGFVAGRPRTVLATVPPQHMYGLETSVLLPLLSASALCAERPFYPADICAALASAPGSRVLVSTPVHLRALLGAQLELPPVDLLVSATAPISCEFAAEVEQRFGAPLLEIYGSTETGQIASRRPSQREAWQIWDGVRMSRRDDRVWVEGGHVERATPLGDDIDIVDDSRFVLGSRLQDVVNIAGKRNSIDHLNHQLLAIPGVCDGAFFLPDDDQRSATGVVRLSALVVAPTLDAKALLRQLRARIDPVFLPRPLLLVPALPRNSTGKLPLQSLRLLYARLTQ